MQDAANILLGIVIIFALVTLSALILLRGRARRKNTVQVDRRDTFQPPVEPATARTGKFAFLGKIFGMFRRKKSEAEAETLRPELTETLEALEAISAIETTGDQEEPKFPELTQSSSEEELTAAEVEVFTAFTNPEGSTDESETSDNPSEESGDGIFGGGDDSLQGAFKAETVVDNVREALLARVGTVELKDLADEISTLTSRVKAYVPENPDS